MFEAEELHGFYGFLVMFLLRAFKPAEVDVGAREDEVME